MSGLDVVTISRLNIAGHLCSSHTTKSSVSLIISCLHVPSHSTLLYSLPLLLQKKLKDIPTTCDSLPRQESCLPGIA